MYPTLADWTARAAIPFALDAPTGFNAAVDRMMAALGPDVELLGLGEAMHGGEDLLLLRNRLFQRLAEAHGYTAIALESSFPRARLVNEYVQGRGPASYDAVQEAGFSHGFGKLETSRELAEWMRRYNARDAHPVKLHCYGFDSPTEMMNTDSPRQLLLYVLDYLASVDGGGVQERRQRIDALLGDDAAWENPAAMFDPTQSIGLSPNATALRLEADELISQLRVRRPELAAKAGHERYLEARQYAALAQQMLTYHAALARPSPDRTADLLGLRDAMMADNLMYIAARERSRGGKVLAFAHNSHLKRGAAQWQLGPDLLTSWPAGAHLSVMLNYAVIGTGVGVSEGNGIGPPEAGTLEARLSAAPGPGRFIPTYRGAGLPVEEIQSLPVRSGSTKNPGYFPFTAQSFTDFDWLAVLDATDYARGGPPLPS